jgi:hypothetical protein
MHEKEFTPFLSLPPRSGFVQQGHKGRREKAAAPYAGRYIQRM